jgi:S1-C subfamily serine protease
MNPIVSLLLALLVLGAAPAAAHVALDDRDLTVVITTGVGDATAIGAGVVIRRNDGLAILTAAHVLAEGAQPQVRTADGLRLLVRSIERIPGHDLALIYASAPLAPLRVAVAGRPAIGEPLVLWGHPLGKPFTLAHAMVLDLAVRFGDGSPDRLTIACPTCDTGDSGAGVFDEGGSLVGILTAAIVDGDRHRIGVWLVESLDPISAAVPQRRNAAG